MRIVFMGTPEFAVPSLDALVDGGYEVVGVFTQPDRPVGRGNRVKMPPVKARALELGVDVFQFARVRAPEGVKCMRALAPDLVVTAAFGQILSEELLHIPPMGTINVHASLLPRHRGAAPINWSILMGETVTGVTTMLTEKGLDTGDMLLARELEILPEETAGELTGRLSYLGAQLLLETVEKYAAGEIVPRRQNPDEATYEPMLNREMGKIDWSRSALEIVNQVRGLNPWPCAYAQTQDGVLKVFSARPADGEGEPGRVLRASAKEGLVVACAGGALEILEMQAPNARKMAASAYLNGRKIEIGASFKGE